MRHLVVVRGAPGAGKTHLVHRSGLEPFHVAMTDMRLLVSGTFVDIDGSVRCDFSQERHLKSHVGAILERKMLDGHLVVIEGTFEHYEDLSSIDALASRYRYTTSCVDLSTVPIERCLSNNARRPDWRRAPDYAIIKAYERYASQRLPRSWRRIAATHAIALGALEPAPVCLDAFREVLVVGDVHGCMKTLMRVLDGGFRDDCYYVLLGDYIDRGPSSGEVLRFLFREALDRDNVVLLWGNHEDHLYRHILGLVAHNTGFRENTLAQINQWRITKHEIADFCDRLEDVFVFSHRGRKVIATHGGLSCVPASLVTIASKQLRRGIGKRATPIDALFSSWVKDNRSDWYQVHGHRNLDFLPTFASDRSFNLEGRVEAGGVLRALAFHESSIDDRSQPCIDEVVYRSSSEVEEA